MQTKKRPSFDRQENNCALLHMHAHPPPQRPHVPNSGLHPTILQIPNDDSHTRALCRLGDKAHVVPQPVLVAATIAVDPSGDGLRYRAATRVCRRRGIWRHERGLVRRRGGGGGRHCGSSLRCLVADADAVWGVSWERRIQLCLRRRRLVSEEDVRFGGNGRGKRGQELQDEGRREKRRRRREREPEARSR